jgi:ribosomal protein S6
VSNDIQLDCIWGARAIAKAINKGEKATYHLLEKKLIPARKIGEQWVARRSELERHFTAQEDGSPR